MEFIDGETLRRLIARDAPLEPVLALDYLEPIASALQQPTTRVSSIATSNPRTS